MNRSIEVLKNIYKPYRYTIKGKTYILESTSGNFVVKESDKPIGELFSYLKSRSFYGMPKIIDESRDNAIVYEYLEDVKEPSEQKLNDLISVVVNLHNKTAYYKEVSDDKFKEIYENIKNNILYLKDYYNNIFDEDFNEIYASPSNYLFMRSYTKINNSLTFCLQEIDKWWDLVKDLKRQRVCLVHNNLKLDHYIKNDKDYLISWDRAMMDSPIVDLISLYKENFYQGPFDTLLKKYLDLNKLNADELKLFFIMISIPDKILFNDREYAMCNKISNLMDYIYKTERLIRPYYTEQKKE